MYDGSAVLFGYAKGHGGQRHRQHYAGRPRRQPPGGDQKYNGCHHRAGGRHPDRAGSGRVSGYRLAGHDGGSVREFYRCADLLDHRVFLCEEPRRE